MVCLDGKEHRILCPLDARGEAGVLYRRQSYGRGTQNISSYSDGILNIGSTSGYHLTSDNNELHAKYGISNSKLCLNGYGGDVEIANTLTVEYSGAVGIGTTSPSYELDVSGQIRCTFLIRTSDIRLKDDIMQIDNPLEMAMGSRGVSFKWKVGESSGKDPAGGRFATGFPFGRWNHSHPKHAP